MDSSTKKVSGVDLEAGRRAFLRTAGLGGLALAAGVPMLAVGQASAQARQVTDADIFNFALNLEYLEAEFYLRAVTGEGLSPGDITGAGGPPGTVSGGRKVTFKTKAYQEFAEEIARDEEAHVRFLRETLGSSAVSRPRIDIGSSFTAAARAAGLIKKNQEFDAYANEDNFLLAAFIFEDVGVTAYKGAARLIENKDYLESAAGILAVEAYHAGAIRTLLYLGKFFKEARAISNLRDKADGGSNLDQGIGSSNRANIVPADQNAIAFSRTTDQVLRVVYLGEKNRGGFFPQGTRGEIS